MNNGESRVTGALEAGDFETRKKPNPTKSSFKLKHTANVFQPSGDYKVGTENSQVNGVRDTEKTDNDPHLLNTRQFHEVEDAMSLDQIYQQQQMRFHVYQQQQMYQQHQMSLELYPQQQMLQQQDMPQSTKGYYRQEFSEQTEEEQVINIGGKKDSSLTQIKQSIEPEPAEEWDFDSYEGSVTALEGTRQPTPVFEPEPEPTKQNIK